MSFGAREQQSGWMVVGVVLVVDIPNPAPPSGIRTIGRDLECIDMIRISAYMCYCLPGVAWHQLISSA